MTAMISPNQLTVLRMAFVPVMIVLITYGYVGWALIVFLCAGLTDMLDGLIARKWGQKTMLGTFLDPIADKVLLVSSFAVLTFGSLDLAVRIPLWLTIAVISRDLLLVLSVLVFSLTIGLRVFPPSMLGKATTVAQLLLVMMVLIGNSVGWPLPGLDLLIYVVLVLTLASGVHYMVQGMKVIAGEAAASS
jgi:cardiolipin synthase (CMP-forming)